MIFKISNITNLQDARYCAAMGFDLMSFNLERGNPRKLEAPVIWNLANWLEGVQYVLETNTESLEEVHQLGESVPFQYLALPLETWDVSLTQKYPALLLRGGVDYPPVQLLDLINQAQSRNQEVKVELVVNSIEEAEAYSDMAQHTLFNLPEISMAIQLIENPEFAAFGFSFRTEVEEGVGMLNYDLLDSLMTRIGRGNEQENA